MTSPANAARAVDRPAHDDIDLGPEVSDTIESLLPWGISILLHAGVILIAVFAVYTAVGPHDESENVPLINNVRLGPDPGGTLMMGPQSASLDTGMSRSLSLTRSTSAMVTPDTFSSGSAGLGKGSKGGSGNGDGTGNGNGAGDGVGTGSWGGSLGGGGSGSGGKEMFGGFAAGNRGPKASFFGPSGGNAYKVVYMIDASGSLIDTMPFVLKELKRSVGELSDQQQFAVIFFQGSRVLEPNGSGLKKATLENRQRLMRWIDAGNVIPGGSAETLPAFKVALSYKPDLLFILSDDITGSGSYQVDQKQLLTSLAKIRKASPLTRINTIQFLYPDRLTSVGMKGTMELISRLSNGQYKFLDGKELGFE